MTNAMRSALLRLCGFAAALGLGAIVGQPLLGAAYAFGLLVAALTGEEAAS